MWFEAKYQAVDDETGAAEGYLPDVGHDLLDAGFGFAGWIRLSGGGQSEISAALTTPDELAFAFPLWVFDAQQVTFKTLLEDGTIVDTATLPRQYIPPVLRGKVHHPRAGHVLNAVAMTSVEAMLASHEAAVAHWCELRGTRVRPHDDVALAVVIQNRLARIRIARFWGSLGVWLVMAMIAAVATVWVKPAWFAMSIHVALSLSALTWWAPALSARLPIPQRRSAAALAGPAPKPRRALPELQ